MFPKYSLSIENKKYQFYSKVVKAEEEKGQNTSRLLYRNEYKEILNRLEELKFSNAKKNQKYYRLLRKYEVLEVTVDAVIFKKLIYK